MSKNIELSFYFLRTAINPFGAKSGQIDVLSAHKCSCLSRCVGARIVVVKSDPSSAVSFPDLLEDNWQTNGCVPLRIDMSSFLEKTGNHLLGSASCAISFCWIWLISKSLF